MYYGTEFTSKAFDQWAYMNGVEIDFTRPGKPTENGLIESFNGRVREECLNGSWFLSIEDAREKVRDARVSVNSANATKRIPALLMPFRRDINGVPQIIYT